MLEGVQTIPDKRLSALGHERKIAIRVPYFGAALECVAGTDLVLTATSSAARSAARRHDLRVVEASPEITAFAFQAVWHPRVSTDPAHRWLRERLVGLMVEAESI